MEKEDIEKDINVKLKSDAGCKRGFEVIVIWQGKKSQGSNRAWIVLAVSRSVLVCRTYHAVADSWIAAPKRLRQSICSVDCRRAGSPMTDYSCNRQDDRTSHVGSKPQLRSLGFKQQVLTRTLEQRFLDDSNRVALLLWLRKPLDTNSNF